MKTINSSGTSVFKFRKVSTSRSRHISFCEHKCARMPFILSSRIPSIRIHVQNEIFASQLCRFDTQQPDHEGYNWFKMPGNEFFQNFYYLLLPGPNVQHTSIVSVRDNLHKSWCACTCTLRCMHTYMCTCCFRQASWEKIDIQRNLESRQCPTLLSLIALWLKMTWYTGTQKLQL